MSAPAAAPRFSDFIVERDYRRLRSPLLGLLRRDGWQISDDEWDAAWNAVCANVWRRQQVAEIDFRGEPLNYLLAAAKNELRRERQRIRPDVLSLDADDAPEPASAAPEPEDELDQREKLRLARTIARHRLRPRELRVWGLRVVCGLTYEQGADRLGITAKRFEKELLSAHAKIADEIRAVASGTWCDSTKGVSLLRAYEQGVLDPEGDALRELREHASGCPACRRAMKTVEGVVPLLLPPAPILLALTLPGGVDDLTVRAVDHATSGLVSAGPESVDRSTHAFASVRRAASELWHTIAGSPVSAGAAQAGGEGGAAATATGVGLLGAAGAKAIAACLTAGALGTCLTVAAVDAPEPTGPSHHARHATAKRHAAAARPAPAPAPAARPPLRTTASRPAPAPSLARAAKRDVRRTHVLTSRRRPAASAGAPEPQGGEFQGQGFESQSTGGTGGATAAGRGGGGGSGSASPTTKPSGGEFSSGGFEK